MAKGAAGLGLYLFGHVSETNGFEAVVTVISAHAGDPSKEFRRPAASRAEAETTLRSLAIEVMKEMVARGSEVLSVQLS